MNQTATPATRPAQSPAQQQMNTIKALLQQSEKAIASRLPKHLTPDRITKVALTAINRTPKLLECTRESLLMSIMQAAELGLEPGGALGEGYLVPYGKQCQFIPGYRGLISLARRSGQIVSIEAHVVHDKDAFSCTLGLDPELKHTPAWDEADPGKLRFVYAVAKLKDGGVQFEVMSRAGIEAIRVKSKAGNSGPWVDHYEEMARKTVVRRLFKYLPVSVELAQAMELQAGAEKGDFEGLTIDTEAIETPAAAAGGTPQPDQPRRSRSEALRDRLAPAPAGMVQGPTGAAAPEPAAALTDDDQPWPDES